MQLMVTSTQSTVQILVERGLHKPVGRGSVRASAGSGFRVFSYTRKKGSAGRFRELPSSQSASSAGFTVTVFGFAKVNELSRARKLVKEYTQRHQPMIAVASPEVFNVPEFRSILTADNVQVLVEEKSKFQVRHLDRWIAMMIELPTNREPVPGKLSLADPLDLSTRLRDPATGRLDARKLAELLGMSSTALATKVCGVTKQAINQSPASAGIQEKLQPLEDIAQLLFWCGGDESRLRAWLNRPNRDFPDVNGKVPSPMDLILRGHAEIVAQEVQNLRVGNPS